MDTIYALSTGASVAGVAIIRISGSRAKDVARLFGFSLPAPRVAGLRRLTEPGSANTIDEALVLYFPGPRSFTGEDLLELQVHGSRAVTRWLLRCLEHFEGFRPAAPGEFSRRAFRNGKADLLDIEALGDLLGAETRNQALLTERNRQALRESLDNWRQRLIEIRALTEALIDFSDEDDVIRKFDSDLEQQIEALRLDIAAATERNRAAEIVRDGFRVALLGAPNSGKSSLLNALARRDVAIVSDIPGTTRDLIEVHFELGGQSVILIDTAGIRDTGDQIEQQGIERARRAADLADYRVWLTAADDPGGRDNMPETIDLAVISKGDLIDSPLKQFGARGQMVVSARTGTGLTEFMALLSERASGFLVDASAGLSLLNARQRASLADAERALREAIASGKELPELRAESLRIASTALDRLIGRIEPEDVLDGVFSRFCIGK